MPIPFLKSKREKELEQKVSDLVGENIALEQQVSELKLGISNVHAKNSDLERKLESTSRFLDLHQADAKKYYNKLVKGNDVIKKYREILTGIRVYRFGDVDVTYKDDEDFVKQVSEAPRVTVTAPKDVALELLQEQHKLMQEVPNYTGWMATRFPSVVAAQQEAGDG